MAFVREAVSRNKVRKVKIESKTAFSLVDLGKKNVWLSEMRSQQRTLRGEEK